MATSKAKPKNKQQDDEEEDTTDEEQKEEDDGEDNANSREKAFRAMIDRKRGKKLWPIQAISFCISLAMVQAMGITLGVRN